MTLSKGCDRGVVPWAFDGRRLTPIPPRKPKADSTRNAENTLFQQYPRGLSGRFLSANFS
jgi:hypothetical protein